MEFTKQNVTLWMQSWGLSLIIHGVLLVIVIFTFISAPLKSEQKQHLITFDLSYVHSNVRLQKNWRDQIYALYYFNQVHFPLALSQSPLKKNAVSTEKKPPSTQPKTETDSSFQESSNSVSKEAGTFYPHPHNALLRFPKSARGLSGKGIFRLFLEANGSVKRIELLSGDMPEILRISAEKTLLTWSFCGDIPRFVDVPIRYDSEPSISE